MSLIKSLIASAIDAFTEHQYDHLFTSDEAAVQELLRRRQNHALERSVHESLHNSDELLKRLERPTAILFRQLASPTHEILHFLETAKRLSLQPLILEYYDDKFVGAGNPYKRTLGKLPLFQHVGSDGRDMVRYVRVIDFNLFMGKKIGDVCCISGKTLVEFHHDLLQKTANIEPSELCFNASPWFQAHGSSAVHYYTPLMSLFVRDAILFENFEETPELLPFMRDIVIPAYEHTEKQFLHNPIIVRLIPKRDEQRLYWYSYPKQIENLLP
ncbi:hypothetical protein HY969_02455 [Candidatus Kaiserbacteria bacterium]|nr:hypothetical protein [Candidatus Kaiserbacteria bacterium]